MIDASLPIDHGNWVRGRGWSMRKETIVLADPATSPAYAEARPRVIAAAPAEHRVEQ